MRALLNDTENCTARGATIKKIIADYLLTKIPMLITKIPPALEPVPNYFSCHYTWGTIILINFSNRLIGGDLDAATTEKKADFIICCCSDR